MIDKMLELEYVKSTRAKEAVRDIVTYSSLLQKWNGIMS
jgi:hypothetical protein